MTVRNDVRSPSCHPQTPTTPTTTLKTETPTPTTTTPPPPCSTPEPQNDGFGASPLEQAAAFMGIVALRANGVDLGAMAAANPELKADLDKLVGAARGVGAALGINIDKLVLPDAELRAEAQQAFKEGRVDGRRHANCNDNDVNAALSRDWTPVRAQPTGPTGVVPLSQLDSNATLGNGPRTIRQAGCLLTSMTMVSNAMTGATRSPAEANQQLKSHGGFSGSSMNTGAAANALGLRLTSRSSFTGNTGAIDRALQAGRPVVVGVDYKAGSSSSMGRTDHFVVITGRNPDGSYQGINSAGGRPMTFTPDGHGGFRSGKYSLSEVMTFDRR